jgi:hypothetical protein
LSAAEAAELPIITGHACIHAKINCLKETYGKGNQTPIEINVYFIDIQTGNNGAYIIGKNGSRKEWLFGFILILLVVEKEHTIVDFDLATLKENNIRFFERKKTR